MSFGWCTRGWPRRSGSGWLLRRIRRRRLHRVRWAVGTVLGIRYNTEKWTWEIPEEKLGRLNEQIVDAIWAVVLPQREVWSLVGRIVHYCPLVPAGRFNVGHLIGINGKSADKEEQVEITEPVKRQLHFWLVVLNVSSGLATIPPPITGTLAWAREFYTDVAAGRRRR